VFATGLSAVVAVKMRIIEGATRAIGRQSSIAYSGGSPPPTCRVRLQPIHAQQADASYAIGLNPDGAATSLQCALGQGK
jgi:hypothetical protein